MHILICSADSFSCSLDDDVVELAAPQRDLFRHGADFVLISSSATDDQLEAFFALIGTIVRVLCFRHVGHVVLTDTHPLEVEEHVGIEHTLERVRSKVRLGRIDVKAKRRAVLHCNHEV